MDNALVVLEAKVLGLPKTERSWLLDRLVASLDRDDGLDLFSEAVAAERRKVFETGAVEGISLDEVLARLEAKRRA